MEKYIKQEVPDMQKTGEQKVFYRMKVERNIDFQEFIHIPQLPMSFVHSAGMLHRESFRWGESLQWFM